MKIKIAYLISTLSTGGAEKQLVRTINLLDQNKYEVYLFVLTGVGDLQIELAPHVKVVYLNFKSYANPINQYKLIKHIRNFNPEILHSVMYASNLLARFYKIFNPKVRLINHVHGLGSWVKKPHIILDRLFLPFVDKIILVSKKSMSIRLNREKYPLSKMEVIYNCVNTELYKPIPKEENSSIVFGIACRLIPLKNVDFAIKLIKQLRDIGLDVKLKIAGDGPEYSSLTSLVEDLELNESVEFKGLVNNMPQFYQNIDYFILCSKTEDLPLSIVEALSCGKIFISSDVGGVNELAYETESLLYNRNDDFETVTATIEDFINISLSKTGNNKNRDYVLDNFSEKIHKQKIEKLYTEVLKN